jgi:serine/threonine protein kinase
MENVTDQTSKYNVSFDAFELGEYMQEGGWGKVYSATRKSDGRKVAMKFFGYTKARPDVSEINREIGLMIKLDRVQGVCQLVGIFQDTAEGIRKSVILTHSLTHPLAQI